MCSKMVRTLEPDYLRTKLHFTGESKGKGEGKGKGKVKAKEEREGEGKGKVEGRVNI